MGKKKKKWIDKKKATTYKLVYRSQDDPLKNDYEAPQMLLAPLADNNNNNNTNNNNDNNNNNTSDNNKDEQLIERMKYGIYYADDYNYMQHLKSAEELRHQAASLELINTPLTKATGLKLPPDVLASTAKCTQLIDPSDVFECENFFDAEIEAALADDIDICQDDIMEDDFVLKANIPLPGEEFIEDYGLPPKQWEEILGDYNPFKGKTNLIEKFENEHFTLADRKSCLTGLSLTSSAVYRNEGMRLVDDCFDKLIEEYDEGISDVRHEDMIAVDDVTIKPDALLNQVVIEFESQLQISSYENNESNYGFNLATMSDNDDTEKYLNELFLDTAKNNENWDCESILSTYSNIYNHPKLIEASIRKNKSKTTINSNNDNNSSNNSNSNSNITANKDPFLPDIPSVLNRTKLESREEKTTRKNAVKDVKRLVRERKRNTKEIYKIEKLSIQNRLCNIPLSHIA